QLLDGLDRLEMVVLHLPVAADQRLARVRRGHGVANLFVGDRPNARVSRVISPWMNSASAERRSQGRSAEHSTSECEAEDAASGVQSRRIRLMICDSGH